MSYLAPAKPPAKHGRWSHPPLEQLQNPVEQSDSDLLPGRCRDKGKRRQARHVTLHRSGDLLGDNPLSRLQQRLPVTHFRLRACARERRAAGRGQLFQFEEIQASRCATKEPAATEAATPVPAPLIPQGVLRPQEPQPAQNHKQRNKQTKNNNVAKSP